jgi:large repetitive protein
MKGGSVRRLCAAVVVLGCFTALAGGAAADETTMVSIAATPPSVTEGTAATFTVTRTGDLTLLSTLTYSTEDGTATAGSDYTGAQNQPLTFAPFDDSETITIATTASAHAEPPENFRVRLSGPTVNATIANAVASVTIVDDDVLPTVSISGAPTPNEGEQASFNVSLSAAYPETVTVDWGTQNGTATAGSDYTASGGTVTFAPGETGPKTVTVNTTNDSIDEDNETFTVNLSAPSNATIGTGSATATIQDGDDPPAIASISDVTVTEGNSATVNASFVVTLSAASGRDVSVQYSTAEGTATATEDFVPESGTVTFPAGATSRTIDVAVKGDTVPEPDEHFFVNLFGAVNAASIADAQGKATITNDDTPPSTTTITDPTVTEGNTGTVAANFVVSLSSASSQPVTIRYSTVDGSAKAPDDYVPASNQAITIPPGQTSGTISVEVKGDTIYEGTENFFVNLLSAVNATLGPDTQGQATITDDDPLPTITLVGAQVTEGTGSTVNLDFKVRLSASSAQRAAVTAFTQDGSAVAPTDYQQKSQRFEWAPNVAAGELEKTFTVVVNGDQLDEPEETITVRLADPAGATVAVGEAVGRILDNDHRSMLSISNAEANEGSAGTNGTMTFKITLSPASARTVNVAWATANGTATAGSDYTAASGTVAFAPFETEKSITIQVLGDNVNEENETVLVNLTGASGAGVADGQGLGTIVDKNAPPSLSIDDPFGRESEGATFTVTLAGTTLRTVTVSFSTADGTAREGTDYSPRRGTLTFAPGEKSKTVVVTVIDDNAAESLENFSVNLGDPVNGVITKSRGVASIEANDQGAAATAGSNATAKNPTTLPVTTPKTKTPTVFPRMVLGPRSLTLTPVGRAMMRITCAKTSKVHCVGVVALESISKPTLVLAKRSFAVKKGRQGAVPLRLSDRGFGLVQTRRSMNVRAVVFLKAGGKTYRIVPGVVLVKATKKPETRVQVKP